ncbi:MAG: YdcF family protein [Roseburia sp.]|nr:YdcF family protein [Roseburia sp.]
MKILQYLMMGIGVVFIVWFVAPLFANGLVNLGTITGIGIGALLLIYGLFMGRVHRFLAGVWQKSGGKVALSFVAIIVAAIVVAAAIETVLMVRAATKEPPANTTAVVLGCSVKGTRPSRILAERLEAAYEYLIENPEAVCVLSGGQGAGEDITEAECMYRYLIAKGISAERLIKEDKSTNTEENLRYTKELLEELGLGNEITIVTSEFHEYRANVTAEKLGFVSYSTPSWTHLLYLPTYYVRELYGILYYMIGK